MQIQNIIQSLHVLGLQQKHLVKLTGVPACTLSRWANGEAPTAAKHTLALSDVYRTATSGSRAAAALRKKAEAAK